MTTPQPAGQMQQTTKGWADCLDVAIETEDWSLVEEIRDDVHAAHGAAWSASLSAADRVETDARVLHSRRHRAGYSHVCDACRGDARAVAAALTATEENAR